MKEYLKITLIDNDFTSYIEDLCQNLSNIMSYELLDFNDLEILNNYCTKYLKNVYKISCSYRKQIATEEHINAIFSGLILEIVNDNDIPDWDNNELCFLCIRSDNKKDIGTFFSR